MLPVQQIASGVLADIVRRQAPSPGRTAFAWSLAVGPALARATTIDLRDGILRVTPKDSRWSGELERARDTILSRLQVLLGQDITEIYVLSAPRATSLDPRSPNHA
jgi:predicted nucleic acid-binding Zn ribbon protein